MPSSRKFFRTIVQVEVLSEDHPIKFDDLEDLNHGISQGDWSGKVEVVKSEPISAQRAAKLLMEQGSDPGFFQLDEKGD